MLEYIAEQAERDKQDDFPLDLERQLTLSGFLVWLRERQREQQ